MAKFIGPFLDGTNLAKYPPKIDAKFREITVKHELALGNNRFHIIGFMPTFELIWDRSYLTYATFEQLRVTTNRKASVTFIPYPTEYPNSIFTVHLTNGLDGLRSFQHVMGYQGSIQLEGLTAIQNIPAWAV